jgi:hypothetical protein
MVLLMTTGKNDILILVFQQKEEYSNWATDPELKGIVLPLQSSDLKISIFQEPDGVSHRHHVHIFFDDFARSYSRMYAQRLGEDVEEKESKKLPKNNYLPWTIFTERLEFKPGHGYVENRYRESMLYACKDWKNCFGDIFDYYQSDMLNMIYGWSGLCPITIDAPIAASTALITTIVRNFNHKSRIIFESGGIPKAIIYIIEDSTILTDEKELGETSPLVQMSFIARMYRQGFIFVGHNISTSFSKKLLSILESIIINSISEIPRVIQNIIICSELQAQVAPTLKPGECISLIPSFHPHAVLGEYPFVQPPRKLTEAERQDIVGPFIEKVKAVKFIERALPAITIVSPNPDIEESKNFRLPPNELQLLIAAGTGKLLTKTQLYNSLKLNRRCGKKSLITSKKRA